MTLKKSFKKIKISMFILILLLIIPNIMSNFILIGVRGESGDSKTFTKSGILEFNKNYGAPIGEEFSGSAPNVTAVIEKIENFDGNDTALGAGESVSGYESVGLYNFELRLTYLKIINDKDLFDAGDIHFSWVVNELIDDDMVFNHYYNSDLGAYNDGDEGPLDLLLYNGTAIFIHLFFELYDDDPIGIDLISTRNSYLDHTYSIFHVNDTDGSLEFTLTKTLIRAANAQDYLDAYKPRLYLDDEDGNIPPSTVYGRVLSGFDPSHAGNGVSLQYIFYWDIERTGTGNIIHYWDFEEVLIYIDWTESYYPYRYVFDNGFYFNSEEDWRDGQDYKIFDGDSTNLGKFYKNITFTTELQPLLGESRTMEYEIKNVSEVYDSGYENFTIGNMGLPTAQLTVETSYHSFDLGDASVLVGGEEYGQNYTVNYMTDNIIKDLYGSLNRSFHEGLLETYQTPKYSPFSFDLCQPFESPYIINNFPTLLTDASAFNGAKERNLFGLEIEKNIDISMSIPYSASMDFPERLTPGTPYSSEVSLTLNSDSASISVDYFVNIYANYSLWFFEKEINLTLENTITLDFGRNTLTFGDFSIDLEDSSTIGTDLSNFVEFTITGNLQLVGTILESEIKIKLNEILKNYLPQFSILVDMFFEELNFLIKPELSGSIDFGLYLDNDGYDLNILNTSSQLIPIEYTPRAIINPDDRLDLILKNFEYQTQFSVDWGLQVIWPTVVSSLLQVDSWNKELGTWPDFEMEIYQSTSEFVLLTYNASAESDWIREDVIIQMQDDSIPGYEIGFIGGFSITGIIFLYIYIKKKQNWLR